MKSLLKIMMAFVMAFGFMLVGTGAANASEAVDASAQLKSSFDNFPSTLEVGKRYQFTVSTENVGTLEAEGKFFFLVSSGEKMESVKTTLNRTKKAYVTTGYFTPKAEGSYILLYSMKQKNSKGEAVEANAEKSFKTVDKNKINLTVSPNEITAKLGEEIPVLVTYSSSITTKLEFNQKVTELGSSRKNGVYKKVYLWKPEKKGEYTLKVKATQSRTDRVETKEITIVVE
ncbi:hypothetical protein [Brevibacillus choshinensis]|uniref:hypothetical protein n=1 Tax=Brevibacillus choshinensis TaxID=54911 RepID=UPI002E1E5DBC|nr:hypothetical protein [Brevibacillus choshinensis]MED4750095.1 hypothetical protein [Brevibacillus choshinensis]MED4780681.1 hypothetical protein [Brevibacillus choshinensis]